MIVIRMSGGIGNQMFQYALYLKLLSLGREVRFDDVTEYELPNARPVMLSVFGIDYPRAEREDVIRLTDSSMRPLERVRRRLTGRRSLEYHEASTDYDPKVLTLTDAYLCGCFQSERYFKDLKETVRETFRFRKAVLPERIEGQIHAYEEQIREKGSRCVSLHIRRGDYLKAKEVYGGICTQAYYDKAVACMKEWIPKAHFFIFTNDPVWARNWCEAGEEPGRFTVVQGTDEDTGYIDLMLMRRCKNHIIANSSFSWWGAWLSDPKGRTVIAPEKWLNTRECHDIYTPDMARIDAKGTLTKRPGTAG